MTPLYGMIESRLRTHGIPNSNGTFLPTGSFFDDDSLIISKLAGTACHIYSTVGQCCEGLRAMLHPDKCIPISLKLFYSEMSPNSFRVLPASKSSPILGFPLGCGISKHKIISGVIHRIMARCLAWESRAQTHQEHQIVVNSIILLTLWYVLSVLPTHQTAINRMQRVITHYMSNNDDIQWNKAQQRCQLNPNWFYLNKKQGGWGITSVAKL